MGCKNSVPPAYPRFSVRGPNLRTRQDLEGFANANAPVSFTFNVGMDQRRAADGDEIEGELLNEVDS